jgi:hypothetical protein
VLAAIKFDQELSLLNGPHPSQPGESCNVARNPQGPKMSFNPAEPKEKKVRSKRPIQSLHRPILYLLHGGHTRQRRSQYGDQPPRIRCAMTGQKSRLSVSNDKPAP